ncbi:UNC93-like protein [Ciona intestinalis]
MNPSESFSLKKVKNELVATMIHCLKLQQLLLTMFVFHQGMLVGFTTGELTRAYVSCVFGVTQIGVAMSIEGACAFIISLFYGRILGKFGRILPFIGVIALDLAYITFALLWVPNENSQTWEVYLLLGVGGLGVGSASALTYYFVPVFFPNDTARGFASWTLWTGMGNLVQYAWSTSVCVRYKIYTLYGTTALSVVTHVIAEIRHKRKQRKLIMEPKLTEIESQSKFTKL